MKTKQIQHLLKSSLLVGGMVALAAATLPTYAAVSAEEAVRLQSDLTPFGAERKGNADGTIPAWDGGLTQAPANWKAPNGHRTDPFAGDKVKLTITAANYQQHADQLTEGQKAMFKAYPDSFKINVYQTRRTHALPQWVYDNTFKNATNAKLVDDGNGIANAHGGVPFPIPQSGLEVLWNHTTRYQGTYRSVDGVWTNWVQPTGARTGWLESADATFHYYQPDAEADLLDRLGSYTFTVKAPARVAGEGTLVYDYLNASANPRKGWLYSPGERRVRRAPTLAFDTPDRGPTTFDDFEMFVGSPERYDWELVGKKEIFIPYNNYKVTSPDVMYDQVMTPFHVNPDLVRWELHRVWVLEATLKSDQRHMYAKRRFYVDEDSWAIAATEKYDGRGDLWRLGFMYLSNYYDMPLTNYAAFDHMDLKQRSYLIYGLHNEEKLSWDFTKEEPNQAFYTPQALRRRGR